MNSVNLTGRLTADPDFRTTQGGKSVANFRIAVSRFTKGEADFVPCVAWSSAAEILRKYCSKGDKIGVSGHLQTREHKDKEGNSRHVMEVIVESIDLPTQSRIVADPEAVEPVADDDEDLPF